MSTLPRSEPNRSERDELERLQGELREVHRQRELLPRENAELTAQVERLEQEVGSLQRTLAVARGEWQRPTPSLPEQLLTPFQASPSRRTAYGRARYAMRTLIASLAPGFWYARMGLDRNQWFAVFGGFLALSFAMHLFFQGHADDDEGRAWSFDEEGLSPVDLKLGSGKIRYEDIDKVEVKHGWLRRLFGTGTVRVTWTPPSPTSLGKPVGAPHRVVQLELIDEPERLVEWLKERKARADAGRAGGSHDP